jgi:hypothetical protein
MKPPRRVPSPFIFRNQGFFKGLQLESRSQRIRWETGSTEITLKQLDHRECFAREMNFPLLALILRAAH